MTEHQSPALNTALAYHRAWTSHNFEHASGFWETYGYHMYGDPWREQRYSGD